MRQSRQAIRRLKREQPERRIIVTGCGAQVQPQTYAAMPEVDVVLGNAEKLKRVRGDWNPIPEVRQAVDCEMVLPAQTAKTDALIFGEIALMNRIQTA